MVKELYHLRNKVSGSQLIETWHDALQIREEALDLFSMGLLDLPNRATMERLFWSIARDVYAESSALKHIPDELKKISKMLPDKYFCNFSLFQSLPDAWAIDQIFPIIPIHILDEQPSRMATLQDVTCDSDGKVSSYVTTRNQTHTLPVHNKNSKDPYYIGVFLVGAYQEILGDLHNLFGDTNAVHVTVDEKGYYIDQIIDGETVAEVLEYVQYVRFRLSKHLEFCQM